MISVAAANYYLSANVALVVACALLSLINACIKRFPLAIGSRHQLWIAYAALAAALVAPLLIADSDQRVPKSTSVQIWAAPTMHERVANEGNRHSTLQMGTSEVSLSLQAVSQTVQSIVAVGIVIFLTLLLIDVASTLRVILDAQNIRRHGSVRIVASSQSRIPFAFWCPRRYWIVVPYWLLSEPDDLRVTIHHEMQHHRHQDSKCRYLGELIKALFFVNPAVHFLTSHIRTLQELACDEAVIAQRRVAALEYCHCLIRAAERAIDTRPDRVRLSMVSHDSKVLAQRIEAALARPLRHIHTSIVTSLGIALIGVVIGTSAVFGAPLQDRRVSLKQGEDMAARARIGSTLPITMNADVLNELNRLLGTPDGRSYLVSALQRMESYKQLVLGAAERYEVPSEFIAIPVIESGYRNIAPHRIDQHGAGLWMFIPSTAKRFGLQVNASNDQRLDEAAETAAAMKMLHDLHDQFGDWNLALLAFNTGNAKVERGINKLGSRDAWILTQHGIENDRAYLARVTAAILIIKNPAVLK